MNRGDVVLVRFPHPSGLRGKKRPAVIVQSDAYAGLVGTLVVAEVTKNLTMRGDPACLFIDVDTPDGKATLTEHGDCLRYSLNHVRLLLDGPALNWEESPPPSRGA